MKPTIRPLYDLLSMGVAMVVWRYMEGPKSDKSGARLSIQRTTGEGGFQAGQQKNPR